MSLGFKRANEEPLRCSFCGKDQNSVGKLVSNPGDYSRVYICNECVRICSSIIDDDNPTIAAAETEIGGELTGSHPLLTHPLASELMQAITEWIREESLGKNGMAEVSKMRAIAVRVLGAAATI